MYTSAVCFERALTEYPVGKWARAPLWLADRGYHLLAFKTRAAARIFKSQFPFRVVCKAQAIGVTAVLPPRRSLDTVDMHTFRSYRLGYPAGRWDEGAVMCQAIKLLPNNHANKKGQ